MSFDKLIAKVTQAENALEAHERRVGADLRQLKQSWKATWTPARIVIAGVVGGFLVGRAEPLRSAARGGSLMRIASLLTGVFSSGTAKQAADEAEDAAEDAGVAAHAVAPGADAVASAPDPDPDPDAAAAIAAANEHIAHERLLRAAAAARRTNAEAVD
ncbi:MAG: hypothetical protein ACREPV_01835 [Lysobacter sp.]